MFVIVMEMISRELQAGLPLELLYADNLILMAESEESLHDTCGTTYRSVPYTVYMIRNYS